jgi:aerobic C4-dicarboxylate transport protein
MFRIVNIIMKLAPIGAFGAMAFTIGLRHRLAGLSLELMICFYVTCLLFIFDRAGTDRSRSRLQRAEDDPLHQVKNC